MQNVFIVGGHINYDNTTEKGNVINVPSNEYAEFNVFLDPLAAKTVFQSDLSLTLIPLAVQRKVSAFTNILQRVDLTKKTPEALFTQHLLSRLHKLQQMHHSYQHMVLFTTLIICWIIMNI